MKDRRWMVVFNPYFWGIAICVGVIVYAMEYIRTGGQ